MYKALAEQCKDWINMIQPNLHQDIEDILFLRKGKIGGLFLKGEPNVGKSMLVRLICGITPFLDNVGILSRGNDPRFMFQDACGKDILIGEEYTVNDIEADQLKLWLEGSPLASYELKGDGRKKMDKRIPIILSSNFDLCIRCPRQDKPMKERVLYVNVFTCYNPKLAKVIYSLTQHELNIVFNYLFVR